MLLLNVVKERSEICVSVTRIQDPSLQSEMTVNGDLAFCTARPGDFGAVRLPFFMMMVFPENSQ